MKNNIIISAKSVNLRKHFVLMLILAVLCGLFIQSIALILAVISLFIILMPSSCIYLTDTHVSGKTFLGEKINIPISRIASASLTCCNGITIYTADGRKTFLFLKNHEQLHTILQCLIISEQKNLPILKKLLEKKDG